MVNNILNEISNRMNKLKVALKDLIETEVWVKIIVGAKLIQPIIKLLPSSLCFSLRYVTPRQDAETNGHWIFRVGYLYALAYLNFKYINPLKTQKSQYYFGRKVVWAEFYIRKEQYTKFQLPDKVIIGGDVLLKHDKW